MELEEALSFTGTKLIRVGKESPCSGAADACVSVYTPDDLGLYFHSKLLCKLHSIISFSCIIPSCACNYRSYAGRTKYAFVWLKGDTLVRVGIKIRN